MDFTSIVAEFDYANVVAGMTSVAIAVASVIVAYKGWQYFKRIG